MEWLEVLYMVIRYAFVLAIPLAVISLGGMFSERSGTVNIALEGIMAIGAFVGYLFVSTVEKNGINMDNQLFLILTLLLCGVAGLVFSLLLAVSAITLKADQTIGGTALNIISVALIVFLARMFTGTQNIKASINSLFYIKEVGFLADIPVIGDLFFKETFITTYIGIAILIVAWFVLKKTRFGLRLISCGEFPQAADSVGINVYKTRYIGVAISGFLAGIGGMMFVMPLNETFSGSVSGYGFLAIAILIFGQWKPLGILLGALFFSIMMAISGFSTLIPIIQDLPIPADVYKMLPYIATLVVLAFTSSKSHAPKASGVPYDKSKR